jgi:cobalt transporter subunit CbtB
VLICGGQKLAGVFARAQPVCFQSPDQCDSVFSGRFCMRAQSLSVSTTAVASQQRTAGGIALCLGAALILFVGFAPLSAVHNAAHDTRHSAAFPCH